MHLKRFQRNIAFRKGRNCSNVNNSSLRPDSEQEILSPLEAYIQKLPSCPLYDQLREIRVPLSNYLDFSEVNEKVVFFFSSVIFIDS